MKPSKSNRGDSSIIATLILTSVVIAIGIMLMSFFSGSSAIRESDYFDQTMESVQKNEERFLIEKVSVVYLVGNDNVTVTVFNYGRSTLNITITRVRIARNDVEVGYFYSAEPWKIKPGSLASKTIRTMDLAIDDVISAEVSSSRGSKANDVAKIQSTT